MTKAAKLLIAELEPPHKPKWTQASLARELGLTAQAVNAWVAGRNTPSPEQMARIEDLLGIPMRDWTIEDKEEAVPASGPSSPETKDAANG